MDIIKTWKRIGETPLQAMMRSLEDHKITDPEIKKCYTGRLDPMAQGSMIVLVGSALVYQDYYNSCLKTYRFQAILGVSTSSYDALGDINDIIEISQDQAMLFHNTILRKTGNFKQAFPPCSAVRYKGKPLWVHAKNGTLPQVLPTAERTVYTIKSLHNPVETTIKEYRKLCIDDINDVAFLNPVGFNTDNIKKEWNLLNGKIKIWKLQYEVSVSAGTYVRSLVHDMGCQLGIPAHAFRITRVACL